MKLLLCLAVSTLVLCLLEQVFKKRPYLLYLGSLLLGIGGFFLPPSIGSVITRGTLATSLFILVMYARVFPVKTRLYKVCMTLRAPLAIAGSFLILLHNGKTLYGYLNRYLLLGVGLKTFEIFAAVCSGIMFTLLIPLTVTSFMPIRKKMKAKQWKNLQRTSYLFYFLIYLHVAILFGYQIHQGKYSYCLELAIYTFIFGNYLFLRVALYLRMKKKNGGSKLVSKLGLSFVSVASVLIVCIGIFPGFLKNTQIFEEPTALVGELSTDEPKLSYSENNNSHADSSIPSDFEEKENGVDTYLAEYISEKQGLYPDGEYSGEAQGYNGTVKVKVIISDGIISEIKYTAFADDEDYFLSAWNTISKQVLTQQNTTDVDCVSGATYSSKGILNAIDDALN